MAEELLSEKPKEILELERIYGVKIQEDNLLDKTVFYKKNEQREVTVLSLVNCGIKDISPLGKMNKLKILNLGYNEIEDISPITTLTKLNFLNLADNPIHDISPIASLVDLEILSLDECPIVSILPLADNVKLEELYVNFTQLSSLEGIQGLTSLEKLFAYKNSISSLEPLRNLPLLQVLQLSSNSINDISPLANNNSLTQLSIWDNKIREIAEEIYLIFSPENGYIEYHENPLTFPPISVLDLGHETTLNYYRNAKEFGHQPLSEGRIIFVGDGSSGKSSIIEKVMHNTFDLGREQTNGIHLEHLALKHPEDGRNLNFHIWDFGGQEIQHAVHKFFFTQGCLYVLVLDNRKQDDPEYWLQQIESLGGSAKVMVVFNKQDENTAETVDRKYLREKYPNIVGFYNTSCKTDTGIPDFKAELERHAVQLSTVEEQFPNNWLAIKQAIEQRTSGDSHYLTYEVYKEICKQNQADNEETQKLLLRYFNTIGAVTWFGEDMQLQFLHVLNPAWITQGVYKILTAKKTATLFGQIKVSDFKEMLQPLKKDDYTYDEAHYGYILTMMDKFGLCDTQDRQHLLIPSAFSPMPKIEYSEFKGVGVRTYILQFTEYMPLALIHRFTAKNIKQAVDGNYWYTGIVVKDTMGQTQAMVHADKEAKRIYIRIKGSAQLGMWEHIRRQLATITDSYAKIPYSELVAVDENVENNVSYEDLVSHIQARKGIYFHSKLKQDFNVGYLIGLFEDKVQTLDKIKDGEIAIKEHEHGKIQEIPPVIVNIVNNISPIVTTQVNTQISINIQVINELSSTLKGDANYLIDELNNSNQALSEALQKVIQFANDAQAAKTTGDIKEKGWGRKLKSILDALGNTGEQLKNIQDGKETIQAMLHGLKELAVNFNLNEVVDLITKAFNSN